MTSQMKKDFLISGKSLKLNFTFAYNVLYIQTFPSAEN